MIFTAIGNEIHAPLVHVSVNPQLAVEGHSHIAHGTLFDSTLYANICMLFAICDTASLTCISAVSEKVLFSISRGLEVGEVYGRYKVATAGLP